MARSQAAQNLDRVERIVDPKRRLTPMWAMLRVYKRGEDDGPHPDRWLPEILGGVYDGLSRRYLDYEPPDPRQVVEIKIHEGQLEAIQYPHRKMRVMVLGGPGSGKTELLSVLALIRGLRKPNSTWGMVGATQDRVRVLWDKFLALVGPQGWVAEKREADRIIELKNGSRYVFKAAKEPSKAIGTPIQGQSWDGAFVDESQNVHDRAQMDIDERGRSAGTDYTVWETATLVDGLGHFAARREQYKQSPDKAILRVNPFDNCFVQTAYWRRFEGDYNDRDWRRRILSEDVASDRLVYSSFTYAENIRPVPRPGDDTWMDITGQMANRYQTGLNVRFIVGHDFGVLTSASIVLKVFRHKATGDVCWWAIDEITSGSHTNSYGHALKLSKAYGAESMIVVADPHVNTKEVDKSDYALFERAGLVTKKAHSQTIRVKHRVGMLNALLCDATGKRRFFIDCDERKKERCPRLVQSFLLMEYDQYGNPENVRKNYSDPTHWPAAAAYGMFPWERLHGQGFIHGPDGGPPEDPVLRKAREIASRRAA